MGAAARAEGRPLPGPGILERAALGHTEEALEHLREAQVLDPRSVETATTTAGALVGVGRYPEALETAKRGSRLPQPTSG